MFHCKKDMDDLDFLARGMKEYGFSSLLQLRMNCCNNDIQKSFPYVFACDFAICIFICIGTWTNIARKHFDFLCKC